MDGWMDGLTGIAMICPLFLLISAAGVLLPLRRVLLCCDVM